VKFQGSNSKPERLARTLAPPALGLPTRYVGSRFSVAAPSPRPNGFQARHTSASIRAMLFAHRGSPMGARVTDLQESEWLVSKRTATVRTHLINRQGARLRRFDADARREEREYPSWIFDRRVTQQQRQRTQTLLGWALAGVWRRCSSVTERCGYAPSSRLASLPSGPSAPLPIYEMGSS